MIKFTSKEENKQFVSIGITDGTESNKVFDYISTSYPSISHAAHQMDEDEILLELDNRTNYGFTLNSLRLTVSEVAGANIYTFCVDLSEPTQRYIG